MYIHVYTQYLKNGMVPLQFSKFIILICLWRLLQIDKTMTKMFIQNFTYTQTLAHILIIIDHIIYIDVQ